MLKRRLMVIVAIIGFIINFFIPKMVLAASNIFCTGQGANVQKINTALGCVPIEINEFTPWLLTWLFGVAGGIAFLLMVYGFILMSTSAGDPKKVQGAKETVVSAISGLLMSIFGLFILRLLAVNILHIPGID